MQKVTVLDDYQGVVARLDAARLLDGLDVELNVLTQRVDNPAALASLLADSDGLVLIRERTQITASLLDALPRLRWIVQTGRLSACIDLAACQRRGIVVKDGSGSPIAPTELTWALILAASRRLLPYVRQLEQGHWQRSAPTLAEEALGRSVHGRTLGVWGYGKIGRRVAAIGRAFGMQVLAHGRSGSQQAAQADGVAFIADRREFLSQLDILTLHLRLTPETQHLIGEAELACLRPDALLVNTSRAELLAPGVLLASLAKGRPGAAALDVFADEPDGVAPYLDSPRCCARHIWALLSATPTKRIFAKRLPMFGLCC